MEVTKVHKWLRSKRHTQKARLIFHWCTQEQNICASWLQFLQHRQREVMQESLCCCYFFDVSLVCLGLKFLPVLVFLIFYLCNYNASQMTHILWINYEVKIYIFHYTKIEENSHFCLPDIVETQLHCCTLVSFDVKYTLFVADLIM